MILGTKTRLRPIERDDLPRFVAWFADPDVRDGLALYLPMSLAQEEQWFEDMLKRERETQPFAIEAQTPEGWLHIGSAGFHEIDWHHRRAEFGIAIGEKRFWNGGYGTDATRTMVGFGFGQLNLERVSLRVFADNARAIRCYEKVGFKHEGRLRRDRFHNGQYGDTLIMAILHEEWQAGRA